MATPKSSDPEDSANVLAEGQLKCAESRQQTTKMYMTSKHDDPLLPFQQFMPRRPTQEELDAAFERGYKLAEELRKQNVSMTRRLPLATQPGPSRNTAMEALLIRLDKLEAEVKELKDT